MVAIATYGPTIRRAPGATPALLVVVQEQFRPEEWGTIWDCRGLASGLPSVPSDFEAPVSSDLNEAFILDELARWSDQEMAGFLLDGAQFKADRTKSF